MISLTPWHVKQLTLQRRGHFPKECCAILLGRIKDNHATVENICPIENIADTDQFLMEPQQQGNIMMLTCQEGNRHLPKIVAYYHSHPEYCLGEPSPTDLKLAKQGWYRGVHLIHGADGINGWYWDGIGFTKVEVSCTE